MNVRVAGVGLVVGLIVTASSLLPGPSQLPSPASPAVRFELPASVEMQERAGLIVTGTFIGRPDTPAWIARPSGEWIHILLRDSDGKLLTDRRLWPYAPGRQSVIIPTVVYGRLSFPFEVLERCEALPSGRYRMEIAYDSPGKDQAIALSHAASVALTVRSDKAVPLRHLSLEVPDHVVNDDFRNPQFGLNVRVLNDGCETQNVTPFAPESATVQARASDGHAVSCRSAVPRSVLPPVAVAPMQSWGTFVSFSDRCDIPLPSGAGERTRYRVQVSYRGPGWTDVPLQLDRTVELELANLPHSSPSVRPRPTPPATRG